MRINIFIIIPSLEGGGSERVISNVVKYLDEEKFKITLVLGCKKGKYVEEIPKLVNIIDFKKDRVRYAIFPIIKLIRHHKPDIVLSTLGHLNLLIAFFRPILPKRTKFIARESNTISLRNKDERYPKLFDFLFKTVYKNFDLVICQAKSMKKDLIINYNFPEQKLKIINNPVDFDKIEYLSAKDTGVSYLPKDKYNLLVIGRLTHQKRMDHAIKVMSCMPDNFHLTIAGEGELKEYLEELVVNLNLKDKVTFKGFVKNPYVLLKEANLVLSTSRYEGFPNVVLEANACGKPVLAYKYIGGIDEIIENDVNGELIEDGNLKLLSEALIKIFQSNNYNDEIIRNLTKQKYNVKHIVAKYESEFFNILK